jgi:chemotaxis protein MotB
MSGKKGKGGKKGEGAVRPIIVRRFEIVEGGHHGGAWKVAYADFVTAMMAFFLLMWLLNATTDAQKRGIADYFSPISAMSHGASGTGKPFGGRSPQSEGAMVSDLGSVSLLQQVKQTADSSDDDQPEHGQPQRTADAGAGAGAEDSDNPGRGPTGEALQGTASQGDQSSGKALAGDSTSPPAVGEAATQTGDIPLGGSQAVAAQKTAQTEATPQNGKTTEDAAAAQAAATAAEQPPSPPVPRTAQQEAAAFDKASEQIRDAVGRDPSLNDIAKQMTIDATPEGLRIQLLDEEKRSMFQLGSSKFNDRSRALLQKVAPALMKLSEDISITGHTDATPYPGIGRTNWELSTERAIATRRLLAESGLPDQRFRSISGDADRDPLLPSDPFSPANRRIAIVVLRRVPLSPARASQPMTPEGAAAAGAVLNRTDKSTQSASPASARPLNPSALAPTGSSVAPPISTPTSTQIPASSPPASPAASGPATASPAAGITGVNGPTVAPAARQTR